MLRLAQSRRDPVLLVWGHYALGFTLASQGVWRSARNHLEQSIAFYDERKGGTLSEAGVPTDEPKGAPHSPQNFAVGAFSALHRGQRMRSPTPHSEQYFFPAGFSDPHFKQRIEAPTRTKHQTPLVSPNAAIDTGHGRLDRDALTYCSVKRS